MGIDNQAKMSFLYDYYGQLLAERQQEIFRLYHEDNLSLGEIASELGISRQGVHEGLKKAENVLVGYERKLGLISKHESYEKALVAVNMRIAELLEDDSLQSENEYAVIRGKLSVIKETISALDI